MSRVLVESSRRENKIKEEKRGEVKSSLRFLRLVAKFNHIFNLEKV